MLVTAILFMAILVLCVLTDMVMGILGILSTGVSGMLVMSMFNGKCLMLKHKLDILLMGMFVLKTAAIGI